MMLRQSLQMISHTLRDSDLLKKHIYDFLTSDSKIESNFAKALETSTEVSSLCQIT